MTVAVPRSTAAARRLSALPWQASILGVHNSAVEICFALNPNLKRKLSWGKESLTCGAVKVCKLHVHICTCSTLCCTERDCFPAPLWTMEIEDCLRMVALFLSWPRDNLSVLTFMYIRDAKSSIGQGSDICMPIAYSRCAPMRFVYWFIGQVPINKSSQFLELHLGLNEITHWLDLAHFQHIPFLWWKKDSKTWPSQTVI